MGTACNETNKQGEIKGFEYEKLRSVDLFWADQDQSPGSVLLSPLLLVDLRETGGTLLQNQLRVHPSATSPPPPAASQHAAFTEPQTSEGFYFFALLLATNSHH